MRRVQLHAGALGQGSLVHRLHLELFRVQGVEQQGEELLAVVLPLAAELRMPLAQNVFKLRRRQGGELSAEYLLYQVGVLMNKETVIK